MKQRVRIYQMTTDPGGWDPWGTGYGGLKPTQRDKQILFQVYTLSGKLNWKRKGWRWVSIAEAHVIGRCLRARGCTFNPLSAPVSFGWQVMYDPNE